MLHVLTILFLVVIVSVASPAEALLQIYITPANFSDNSVGLILIFKTDVPRIEYRFAVLLPVHMPPRLPLPPVTDFLSSKQFPSNAKVRAYPPGLHEAFHFAEANEITAFRGVMEGALVEGAGTTQVVLRYPKAFIEQLRDRDVQNLLVVARVRHEGGGGSVDHERLISIKRFLDSAPMPLPFEIPPFIPVPRPARPGTDRQT